MSEADVAKIMEKLDALALEVRALTAPVVRVIPEHPMTPAEFGKVVGKSAQTVRRWIDAGELKAKTDVRPYLISPVNARKFLNPKGAE